MTVFLVEHAFASLSTSIIIGALYIHYSLESHPAISRERNPDRDGVSVFLSSPSFIVIKCTKFPQRWPTAAKELQLEMLRFSVSVIRHFKTRFLSTVPVILGKIFQFIGNSGVRDKGYDDIMMYIRAVGAGRFYPHLNPYLAHLIVLYILASEFLSSAFNTRLPFTVRFRACTSPLTNEF